MLPIQISATRIKSWFQYRCERQFIYSSISSKSKYNDHIKKKYQYIDTKDEEKDRAWADAGNIFEDNLIDKQLRPTPQTAFYTTNKNPSKEGLFDSVSVERTRDFLSNPDQPSVQYLFQGSLEVVDDFWVHVLGLSLDSLYNNFAFSTVHPDIIKRTVTEENGFFVITITVIDVKATGKAMLFHKAQVAFYTLLIQGLIQYWTRKRMYDTKKVRIKVDVMGSIWHMDDNPNAVEEGSYARDDFEIQAYEHMVKDFMTHEMLQFAKRIVDEEQDTTKFHVYFKCEQCKFMPHCIKSIDPMKKNTMDISAIARMSGQAKMDLQAHQIFDIESLVDILPKLSSKDIPSNALQRNKDRYIEQAQALLSNEIIQIQNQVSLQMPPHIDCYIYILVDRNPITNTLATLGCGIVHRGQKIQIQSHIIENRQEEQKAVLDILGTIYAVLENIDRENRDGAGKIVHIFTYEPSEATDLQTALVRSLENHATAEIILQFARMFPPDDFMPEPEFQGVHHLPGSSLQRVLQDVYAFPIRVSYDIAKVSQAIKTHSKSSLISYEPQEDFSTPFSSRLPISLCNEIATNLTTERSNQITKDIQDRIIATHQVVQWLEEQNQKSPEPFLKLQKAPFRLHNTPKTYKDKNINILAVQALLEKQAELVQCLFQLAQPQNIRVHNFQCIDELELQNTRVNTRRKIVYLDFTCPKKFAHVDISVDSSDLLLTDGDQDILLRPECWPLDANYYAAQYYVRLESAEIKNDMFHLTLVVLLHQWNGPLQKIHQRVQNGDAKWVLDKGVRDWTLLRLPKFFDCLDA